MINKCLLVLAATILLVCYVQAVEVKKNVNDEASNDESSMEVSDKKKRSISEEKEQLRDALNRYVGILKNRIQENHLKEAESSLEKSDDSLNRPFNTKYVNKDSDEDSDEDDDDDDSDDDDNDDEDSDEDIQRKKKSSIKKKRFRMIYRKRNAQNRLKRFRANF